MYFIFINSYTIFHQFTLLLDNISLLNNFSELNIVTYIHSSYSQMYVLFLQRTEPRIALKFCILGKYFCLFNLKYFHYYYVAAYTQTRQQI